MLIACHFNWSFKSFAVHGPDSLEFFDEKLSRSHKVQIFVGLGVKILKNGQLLRFDSCV